jgi:hypothetical protein
MAINSRRAIISAGTSIALLLRNQNSMMLRLLVASLLLSLVASESCERLKATLTYTQEEAPRDLSTVVSIDVVLTS